MASKGGAHLRGAESDRASGTVLPMRLSGGAFAVYQQLGEKEKKEYKAIKKPLLDAFAVDRFQVYNEFISRKLRPGESVDVYLADLRRLADIVFYMRVKADSYKHFQVGNMYPVHSHEANASIIANYRLSYSMDGYNKLTCF